MSQANTIGRRKGRISPSDQQAYYLYFEDCTNHKRKSNNVSVFTHTPFPTFVKTGTITDMKKKIRPDTC